MIRCPKCKDGILRKSKDGVLKLHSRMLFWENDECFAKCRGCGSSVVVPINLTFPVDPDSEGLYVVE